MQQECRHILLGLICADSKQCNKADGNGQLIRWATIGKRGESLCSFIAAFVGLAIAQHTNKW